MSLRPFRAVLALAALAGCVTACAPGRPAVPPVAVAEAFPPLETLDADLPGLARDARARYERLRVGLRVTGPGDGDYKLVRDDRVISDIELLKSYQALTGEHDLDAAVLARARARNKLIVLTGAGFTLLAAAGFTALALQRPGPCPHPSTAQSGEGCSEAVSGGATLALLGGVGLYVLGCEIAKGVRCVTEGAFGPTGGPIPRAEMERYVVIYNRALFAFLASSEGAAPEGLPEAPSAKNEEDERPTRPRTNTSPHVRLSPFGLDGTF